MREFKKIVEYAFKHGDELVIYESSTDSVWVCFGAIKTDVSKTGRTTTITLKDCSRAINNDGNLDFGKGSYDLTFRVRQRVSEYFIPTEFNTKEFVSIKKHK